MKNLIQNILEKQKELIDWQIDNGTDAIVICGTTGESSTLRTVHHLEAIKFCVDYVNGRVPVIAGAGSNNTECGLDLAVKACEYGVDALLLVTPYYNKCTQKGLIKHYTMYHDATNVPIILYNVPSRTGVNIAPETLKELSKLPRINGVKEASGNISQVMQIRALCGDELNIWSGNDDQIPAVMACGGKGGSSDKGGALPGIDMKSTDTQTVTSDRATLEVLNETFFTYLGGLNYFTEGDAQSKLTYADLKEHIGVDCSDYRYEEEYQRGVYT